MIKATWHNHTTIAIYTHLSLNKLYFVRLFRFVFALLSQYSTAMFPSPSFAKSKNSLQSMRCFKLR